MTGTMTGPGDEGTKTYLQTNNHQLYAVVALTASKLGPQVRQRAAGAAIWCS